MSYNFLQKVKVKKFVLSVKKYGDIPFLQKGIYGIKGHYREISSYPNKYPDDIYTIIGTTNLKAGYSDWLGSDEGYAFRQKDSKKVYIVAKGIGRRFKVLPEDIELLES